jgi:dTDP-4-amino-4,6-dideoxygalactose transaminase
MLETFPLFISSIIRTKFSNFVGSKYSVSCNSGTDALVLSLRALNIGDGDEVITTPFTYFATAEAIVLVGAKPIFVDINPHTFNINYKNIEKHINKRTKAIMPVHIFGQSAEIYEIKKICRKHNLKLIEDCAQSFGAKKNNKYTGTFGDFGCFSFFPTKNLGCAGDGGMITTNSLAKMKILKKLRNHGGLIRNVHEYIGYNSRLDEIQAGFLSIKLEILGDITKHKRKLASKFLQFHHIQ